MSIEKTYGPAEYLALLEKLVEQTQMTADVMQRYSNLQSEHIRLQKDFLQHLELGILEKQKIKDSHPSNITIL